MKKITTILTALILMFTLTFTTGCKKDGVIDPNKNKTTAEVVKSNNWIFSNGTALRTTTTTDTIFIKFKDSVEVYNILTQSQIGFIHTKYDIFKDAISDCKCLDDINATLVFLDTNGYPDSLFYSTKINADKTELSGIKIESKYNTSLNRYTRATEDITLTIKLN